MYLVGKGTDVEGPGTSTVQRINWTTGQEQQAVDAWRGPHGGMGCACRSAGMGLFDSMDPTSWAAPEWVAVAVGAYALVSMLFTTKAASRRIAALPSDRRKKRAAALRREASELTKRR